MRGLGVWRSGRNVRNGESVCEDMAFEGRGEREYTYIDHDRLVLKNLDSIDPDALHEYLPPAFGALHFTPFPGVFPGGLSAADCGAFPPCSFR